MQALRPALITLAILGASARAGEPQFKKHDINPKSPFEAAGVMDVDGDGKLDVVSGNTWYKGPDFKATYPVREVSKTGTYYNCFSTIPVDLNGDGKPEILPNTTNVVVFYELEKAGKEPKWKKVDLGTAAAGHGVGSGDVNGDGKTDILTPSGWFEASSDAGPQGWKWHGEWSLGATGIQILAKDVDGDGLSDVVYGMGHNRGLFWVKQVKGSGGERAWSKPMSIDPTLSSVHTLMWVDLDGDGKKDEMLTGKRVYAHEIEAGDTEASQIAYYTFDKASNAWVKHPIFQGEPAKDAPKEGGKRDAQKDFPPGTAGTGLEVAAVDIDGDGDIDLVCPGKSGLYWFENLGAKP